MRLLSMEQKDKNSIDDALNIDYVEAESFEVVEQAATSLQVLSDDNSTEEDFQYARENLKSMIEKGNIAIDGILALAKESESPRTYEVAAQLIKTMTEANKDLLSLRKQKRELQKEEPKAVNNTTNNNLFVGSTSELAKMLKAKRGEIDG